MCVCNMLYVNMGDAVRVESDSCEYSLTCRPTECYLNKR